MTAAAAANLMFTTLNAKIAKTRKRSFKSAVKTTYFLKQKERLYVSGCQNGEQRRIVTSKFIIARGTLKHNDKQNGFEILFVQKPDRVLAIYAQSCSLLRV